MDSYMDIEVSVQGELPAHTIMSKVYGQLHLELVEQGTGQLAVCFPLAGESEGLGGKLRLQGSAVALTQLRDSARWQRMSDYMRSGGIRAIPADCDWRRVSRRQPRLSAAKVRRMIARGRVSQEQATELLNAPVQLSEPFVQMQSASSGQSFRLFIRQRPTDKASEAQHFNSYGLGGVVAWF